MPDSTPLVSVIVPVYNVEPYLRECLRSILASSVSPLEIIAVDDGSGDSSPAILDEFAQEGRIKVIHQSNGGPSKARNAGLAAATGEYVGFVDADDWMDDDFLERGHEVLSATPVDKLRFRIRVLNERTGRVRVRGTTPGTTKWTEGMFHATFFRRAVFVENGISLSESRDVLVPEATHVDGEVQLVEAVLTGFFSGHFLPSFSSFPSSPPTAVAAAEQGRSP